MMSPALTLVLIFILDLLLGKLTLNIERRRQVLGFESVDHRRSSIQAGSGDPKTHCRKIFLPVIAIGGIADIYAELFGQYELPSDDMPLAREAALKALALDDSLAEAHHSLGAIKILSVWDWTGAGREFRRAL